MAVTHSVRTVTKTPSPRRIAICDFYNTLLFGTREALLDQNRRVHMDLERGPRMPFTGEGVANAS